MTHEERLSAAIEGARLATRSSAEVAGDNALATLQALLAASTERRRSTPSRDAEGRFASLPVEPRAVPAVCDECRYYRGSNPEYSTCAAYGMRYTKTQNPDGNCPRWTPIERRKRALEVFAGVGIGSVVTTALWWLLTIL